AYQDRDGRSQSRWFGCCSLLSVPSLFESMFEGAARERVIAGRYGPYQGHFGAVQGLVAAHEGLLAEQPREIGGKGVVARGGGPPHAVVVGAKQPVLEPALKYLPHGSPARQRAAEHEAEPEQHERREASKDGPEAPDDSALAVDVEIGWRFAGLADIL
ncbi:MAG TPA: hypothetical protein PKD55_18710, partial [Bellilinea sp.]|nr:hypothetical protein [Bellilinea sp.]